MSLIINVLAFKAAFTAIFVIYLEKLRKCKHNGEVCMYIRKFHPRNYRSDFK